MHEILFLFFLALQLIAPARSASHQLQSVRIPILRDLRHTLAHHYSIEAHIGTPAVIYRLELTSAPMGGFGVFHCLGSMSRTYNESSSSDVIRFTQRSALSARRSMVRTALWHQCDAAGAGTPTEEKRDERSAQMRASREQASQQCATGGECDGVLNLRHGDSPLWRAFSAFTLTRNYFFLHSDMQLGIDSRFVACAETIDANSYCEFDAVLDKRKVRVVLSIDAPTISLPHWVDADRGELALTLPNDAGTVYIDLEAIRKEQAAQENGGTDLLSLLMGGSGNADDDDDDDDLRTASALETKKQVAEANVRAGNVAPFVDRREQHEGSSEDEQRLVLGSSVLLQYAVRKHMVPLAAVEFLPLALREHHYWYETVLRIVAVMHLMALVCHSALNHGMYMAGSLRGQRRVLWIDILTFVVTLLCGTVAVVFTAINTAAFSTAFIVYLSVQIVVNLPLMLVGSFAVWSERGSANAPRYHWRLVYMAASEQLVLMAIVVLSLLVQLDTEMHTWWAAAAAFFVVADGVRNAYKAASLVANVQSSAGSSTTFAVLFGVQLVAVNLVYSAVQLSASVINVVIAATVIDSVAGTALVLAAALTLGIELVDSYRESEELAAKVGHAEQPTTLGLGSAFERSELVSLVGH